MMTKKFLVAERLLDSEPMRRCELGSCSAACCLYGVWVDSYQVKEILDNAHLIKTHMKPRFQDPAGWFEERTETDPFCPSGKVIHSAVVKDNTHYGNTACSFLRADHLCALQVASESSGLHPWHFKPFYCVLHPLDLTDEGRITLDRNADLLDEPASCLRPAADEIPLLETFRDELEFLLGPQAYQTLVRQQKTRKQ